MISPITPTTTAADIVPSSMTNEEVDEVARVKAVLDKTPKKMPVMATPEEMEVTLLPHQQVRIFVHVAVSVTNVYFCEGGACLDGWARGAQRQGRHSRCAWPYKHVLSFLSSHVISRKGILLTNNSQDEMGLGKTIQAIACMIARGGLKYQKTLIVAPVSG